MPLKYTKKIKDAANKNGTCKRSITMAKLYHVEISHCQETDSDSNLTAQ